MSDSKHKPWINEGQQNDTAAIIRAFDEEIAKAERLRELLSDPAMLALVKKVLQPTAATSHSNHNSDHQGPRGAVAKAVYQMVRDMGDEPFTKHDLAQRLRSTGFEIKNAKNALFYPVQKLLAEGVIERVAQGGGGRSSQYMLVKPEHAHHPGRAATVPERSAAQNEPRLKNEMERTAFECVNRLNEPFKKHELIRAMTAAGHVFVISAEHSVGEILDKFIRQGLIVQETNGREQLFRRTSTV